MSSSRGVTGEPEGKKPRTSPASPVPCSGWRMPSEKNKINQKAPDNYTFIHKGLENLPGFPGKEEEVEIWCGTSPVKAVKWLDLCRCSLSFFLELYQQDMAERRNNRIVLDHLPRNVVEELLHFIEQGFPTLECQVEDALPLWDAANLYGLHHIKDWLAQHAIYKDNVGLVATLAHDTYPDLLQACKDVIRNRNILPTTFKPKHLRTISCGACEAMVQAFLRGKYPRHQDTFTFIRNWKEANLQSAEEVVSTKAKELVRKYINIQKLGKGFVEEEAIPSGLIPTNYQIFLKGITSTTYTLNVGFMDTVCHLKQLVQEKVNVPVDQQRLIFAGQQLEDGKTLLDYGIIPESTVHLCFRLRGEIGIFELADLLLDREALAVRFPAAAAWPDEPVVVSDRPVLDLDTRQAMRAVLDEAQAVVPAGDHDIRVVFSSWAEALERFPGLASAEEAMRSSSDVGKFVLRRVLAADDQRIIDWHTDVTQQTMQIFLSPEDEYEGGRTVFAGRNGFVVPQRTPGHYTIHHGSTVHAVTALRRGIRDSAFLLSSAQLTQ